MHYWLVVLFGPLVVWIVLRTLLTLFELGGNVGEAITRETDPEQEREIQQVREMYPDPSHPLRRACLEANRMRWDQIYKERRDAKIDAELKQRRAK